MARYTAVARALHWIIAILILGNLVFGFAHDALPKDWAVMPVHKSIGLTALALTLVRIIWRLTHPAPPLPAAMPAWEKGAAHATHVVFYALMLILPLSGWIMSSAGTRPLIRGGQGGRDRRPVARGTRPAALALGRADHLTCGRRAAASFRIEGRCAAADAVGLLSNRHASESWHLFFTPNRKERSQLSLG